MWRAETVVVESESVDTVGETKRGRRGENWEMLGKRCDRSK